MSPQAGIQFRPESAGLATQAGASLLVAVLLLACALAFALYARRKGWLARWVGGTQGNTTTAGLRVAESLRLSRRTVVYRLVGEREYLVVESDVNARVVPLGEGSRHDP